MKNSSESHRISRSLDGQFGLDVPEALFHEMFHYCALSYPLETGGILVGHYSTNLAVAHVTELVPAPTDSVAKHSTFERGTRGLQHLLRKLWPTKKYYLGEWHFHPDGRPSPSETDRDQMRAIAEAFGYRCPEPVMLIVGGRPPGDATVKSYVFKRGVADAVALDF